MFAISKQRDAYLKYICDILSDGEQEGYIVCITHECFGNASATFKFFAFIFMHSTSIGTCNDTYIDANKTPCSAVMRQHPMVRVNSTPAALGTAESMDDNKAGTFVLHDKELQPASAWFRCK